MMFVTATAFADYNNKLNKISSFQPSENPEVLGKEEGFFERFGDAFAYQKYAMNSNSRSNAFADEIETDLKALRPLMEKDGYGNIVSKTLPNFFETHAAYVGDISGADGNEKEFWEYYDNLRFLYPEAKARPRDEITKVIAEKSEHLRREDDQGKGAFVGGAGAFFGNAAASMLDPVNLLTSAASLFFPSGIVVKGIRGLAKSAVIGGISNMATEAMIQPSVKRFQNEIGNEYTADDAFRQIGYAGAFGVAVPVGAEMVKGIYGGIKSVVQKHGLNANVKIRAAEQALSGKEFVEATNPYEMPDIAAQMRHEENVISAVQNVLDEKGVDNGVRQLRYIDETIAAPMGKKPGYLQLKTANVHPSERHLKDIQAVGFEGVEEYSGFVAQNFDGIYQGNSPGRYIFAVSHERLNDLDMPSKGRTNSLIVEALLIKETGVFDIVTAFPKSANYFKNKKNLLSERAPTNHLQETPKDVSLTGQKQALNKNIAFGGKNVQPVNVGNSRITTQYDVVDLADLKTSDAADYPAELQPRDRTRQASREQVDDIVRHLNPERLGRHTDADRGAPIVGPDGFVESGNGRTMAIRRAYEENPQSAARYRSMVEEEAASMGMNVSEMKHPVLIRRRLLDLTPEERLAFVREANKASSLAYSAAENAALDAEKLDGHLLNLYKGGDFSAEKNIEFVRQFRAKAVPNSEIADFMTADGLLSRAGKERLQAALFAKAYGSKDLARLMFEDESNIKAIGRGMLDAAAEFGKLKEDIAAGIVDKSFDITDDIVSAVTAVRIARAKGISLADYVAQMDMFGNDAFRLKGLLKTFFRDENLKRPVAADKVGEALTQYAENARSQRTDQLSMFNMSQTPDDIIRTHFEDIKKEDILNGTDAKAAVEYLTFDEKRQAAAIDADVAKAKETLKELSGDEKELMDAYVDNIDLAEKLLIEATTCKS